MPSSSSAPVESSTRGSSCGTNGSVTGSEPAAMIACSKLTVVVAPSSAVTSTWFIEVNPPVPETVVTLRCLARPASPPVSRETTPSFQPRSASRSMVGAAKVSPLPDISLVSAMTLAACSSALEGMQPTLRQTPPSGPRLSTMTTCLPRSAARNAAVYPPGPAPSTRTSACRSPRSVAGGRSRRRPSPRRGGARSAVAGGRCWDPCPSGPHRLGASGPVSAASARPPSTMITLPWDSCRPPRPAAPRRCPRPGPARPASPCRTPA